jgi:hypothetical protein
MPKKTATVTKTAPVTRPASAVSVFVSFKELAQYLALPVTDRTLYRLIAAGKVGRVIRIGRQLYWRRADLPDLKRGLVGEVA